MALSFSCAHKNINVGERAADAPRSAGESLPLIGSLKMQRFKLENGLTLFVIEDHTSNTFAYNTWFKVGSRNERTQYTGLAHLFEHMMFKGTKNLAEGQFDKMLEGAGAEGENAFTSRDYTAYVQELPSSQLDLIAKLESDRMVNLIVNDDSFKTEREVVQNERRSRTENNPDGKMYQEIFEVAFKNHAYHWPVIGYEEDLARMTATDAESFYRSHYAPNHATIVVSGDVNPEEVYQTVKKYYGHLKAQSAPPLPSDTEPEQTEIRRKILSFNIQVEKLLMGYKVPESSHEDTPVLDVLATVLAGGKSSRLSRALVETGIAQSVDTYSMDNKEPALLIVGANLQRQKKASQAESVVLREIARFIETGPTQDELERAKNRIQFGFYQSLDTNSERANFIGRFETIAGGYQKAFEQLERIKRITREEVQKAAGKYLKASTRTVITGVPKEIQK